MSQPRKRRKFKCPQCGSVTVVPIEYGMPDEDLIKQAMAGEVLLGGCCIEDGQPTRGCTECDWDNNTYDRPTPPVQGRAHGRLGRG